MRTTIDIDDRAMIQLREKAIREGVSLKELVNRAIFRDLQKLEATSDRKPYRCPTFSMGKPAGATGNLDKALALADLLADAEIARKLEMRK